MSGKEDVPEISPVLFLDAGGQSLRFYVRPGPTKVQLHPLITNGGGTMCRNQEPGAILLIDPVEASSAMVSTGQKYVSSKYIRDCVEQSQQLDLEDYVISVGPPDKTRMKTRHQGIGRMDYSPEDDAAILKFMENRQHEAKGNTIWREMAKQEVTNHSWQSMRTHFLKHLQHKLVDKSIKKSPSKRKALVFVQSPLRKKKATSEPEAETVRKSPQTSVVESDLSETQISSENSLCPTVNTNPPPSPERASSPPEASGDPSNSSRPDSQEQSCVPIREQGSPAPEMSKSSGLDEDRDGQEVVNESNEQSSPRETSEKSCKTSTSDTTRSRLDEDGEVTGNESKSSGLDENRDGQDIANESSEHSSPEKARKRTCKTSKSDHKSSGLDEDQDTNESNEHSSPQKTRKRSFKTSKSDSRRSELDEEGQIITNGPNEDSSPNETGQTTCKTSTDSRSSGLDEDRCGQDIADGSNEHSTPNKTRQTSSKTTTPDSKRLGILAKAAREFEDSDVMDDSEENEHPCEVPPIEPSDAHEGSASSTALAIEPETQAELLEEESPAAEEERPGPSSTSEPPSSHSHVSDSEPREEIHSQVRGTPEEFRSRNLVEIKEHVMKLMSETKKDLVEVTKALLKASGDLRRAQVFLLDGYDNERHGPLWSRLDDEILLLADPNELEQLQTKFGEEEVTRRRAFLTADAN